MRYDAGEISRMLAAAAPQLAAELLPSGRREGAEWRVGSLAGEPGRSCAVHLEGRRAGVWCDFASGEKGDALDLVAAVLYAGDRRLALQWARKWLGLSDEGSAPTARRAPVAVQQKDDAEETSKRSAARRIFLAAQPSLAGTPAAAYLAGRGIDLAELGRQPRALRFHPSLHNGESGCAWPAIVAAICDVSGQHVATHRTWLARDASGRWTKAPVRDPKKTLGRPLGGTIRLWRGASGLPLAQAPEGEVVVLGEGIETCLSIAIACPHLRVLAGISLANMGSVMLPDAVRTVIVVADNDGANHQARAGLQRVVNHFVGQGRCVRIARSPIGKDFNDAIRAFAA